MSGPVVLALRILLAASLYAFLGWAFYNLWLDIRQQGSLLASRTVPPISLAVTQTGSPTQTLHFIQAEVTIGRDPACDCPLTDEAVSARHARLSFHHAQWWVMDLDSTNGTFLNRGKILMPTVVISGDEIRCGGTLLVISLAGGSAALTG